MTKCLSVVDDVGGFAPQFSVVLRKYLFSHVASYKNDDEKAWMSNLHYSEVNSVVGQKNISTCNTEHLRRSQDLSKSSEILRSAS